MSPDILFEPLSIKSLSLPNRIVMAPMGRLFAPNNVPSPQYEEYFAARARGGVGLIIGEASGINRISVAHKTSPILYEPDALSAWARIIAQVHLAGGRFMPQLWHAGRARSPQDTLAPDLPSVGPSDWYIPDTDSKLRRQPGSRQGEPMTAQEIDETIAAFGDAAAAMQKIGCDGIEIHGAHGYLIDQFLWDDMNLRTDLYGGPLTNKVRFAAEIVQEVRSRTGPNFPISFRFSQWKIQDYDARIVDTPAQLQEFLVPLVNAGVDIFHCSTRRFWEPAFFGSELNLAAWTKKISGLTTIAVGSIGLDNAFGVGSDEDTSYSENLVSSTAHGEKLDLARPETLDRLLEMLDRGLFDLIAVGRALIANPDWAKLIKSGDFEKIRPYHREQLISLV